MHINFQFDQDGLTFDDYTNYVGNDTKKYKNAFIDYVSGIALLLGGSNETVRRDALDIWEFEAKLAAVSNVLMAVMMMSDYH